jgi:tripartite-type tricarboxylate transporter receptor subunit TctC
MVRFPRREFLRLAAGAATLPAVSRIASAQSYPSQRVTVIVPSGAGGPTDVIARIVTEHMRGTLGKALVIENVPAANGTLGIGRVSRAKPDGYTIAFSVSSSTHVFNAAIYALPHDVVNDFEPIGLLTKDRGGLIVARKSMPANNLRELITWMRANPGKATLGHTGPGSPAHVAFIVFQKLTGARLQDVAYRSAGQAMQDVIAGHIDMMMASPSIGLAAAQAGSVKAYVVTAGNRLVAAWMKPACPDSTRRAGSGCGHLKVRRGISSAGSMPRSWMRWRTRRCVRASTTLARKSSRVGSRRRRRLLPFRKPKSRNGGHSSRTRA